MTEINKAFWQDAINIPAEIRTASVPTNLQPHEIQIRTHAWGFNPVDSAVQKFPIPIMQWPMIPGVDVCGVVSRTGSSVTNFQQGDRVLATAVGTITNDPRHGGFQTYVAVDAKLACSIPARFSFADGAVLPLGLGTSAHGLYAKQYLALDVPRDGPLKHTDRWLFVWGASSCVGSNAVQLARASGLRVVATCSAKNFDYVRSLGTEVVRDYNDAGVIDDLAALLDERDVAGIFHAAGEVKTSAAVAAKMKKKPFVCTATFISDGDIPDGVTAKMIWYTPPEIIFEETTAPLFEKFLPAALESGEYKVAPPPYVVNKKGVEGIQEGIDTIAKGVSATKIVVENP
ncbi:hypothetical protein ANO11243_093180 [Dothideomycetidae sp. 11243]|nr:hypothetical protein ANO11243_093180 [fungal sp. No.11243]